MILNKKTTWLLVLQTMLFLLSYSLYAYLNLYVYLIYDFLVMDSSWLELFVIHSIATLIPAILSTVFGLIWPVTRKMALWTFTFFVTFSVVFTTTVYMVLT